MALELLIVFVLMLLNGVFAAAEISVLSVRKTRLSELAEGGSRGARTVQWLRSQPERFLATVQIGITVVGTTAAAFGGDQLAEHVAVWLRGRAPWLGDGSHRVALVSVIVLVSILEIVVGELVPKSLALRHAERFSLAIAPSLRVMTSAVRPLVWLLTAASNVILERFGDKTSFTETRLSPEELQELVEEAGRVGSIDSGTSEIASRAIDFRELRAADVMVPRGAIVSVSNRADRDELRRVFAARRFARVLVYEGTPENVTGYVALKDILVGALGEEPLLEGRARPVRFVPESVTATALLRQMQRERLPLVVVLDENGGLQGLVTIEDLVEELVGEILSEGDPSSTNFTRAADGSVVVAGATPIRDVNRALDLGLPEPDAVSTIAGLCLHAARHVLREGERVTLEDGHVLEVIEASPRSVRLVRIHPARTTEATEETDAP